MFCSNFCFGKLHEFEFVINNDRNKNTNNTHENTSETHVKIKIDQSTSDTSDTKRISIDANNGIYKKLTSSSLCRQRKDILLNIYFQIENIDPKSKFEYIWNVKCYFRILNR